MVLDRRWKSLGGLVAMLLLLPAVAPAGPGGEEPAMAPLSGLSILFKRDPRLLGGTYGGEQWLSPRTFTSAAQPGTVGTVDVRVRGVDTGGRLVEVLPEWTPADPERVTVVPGPNDEYRITVKGPGESTLAVAAQGVSRELVVKARSVGKATLVEITQPAVEPPRAEAPPPPPDPAGGGGGSGVLGDRKARNSYALGMEMGEKLRKASMDLDADFVARGVKDALDGEETLLSDEEQSSALKALRTDYQTRRKEARRQLAETNRREGEAFLAENKTKDGVVTLDSGLQYKVLQPGDGPKPTAEDRVVCHYRGTLIDGTEFDSSHKRSKPATFSLKRVIEGWREALPLMPVGSKWQLFVPPGLAYGARGGRGNEIGPNATLVFEIELVGIKGPAGESGPKNTAESRGGSPPP